MSVSFDLYFRYIAMMVLLAGAASFFLFQHSIDPYMDEIFHIPQAEHYCRGDFVHWDPKITTFPGLYYISYLFYRVLNFAKPITCTPNVLRSVNVLLGYGLLFVIQQCREKITGSDSDCWRVAAILFTYPINFFFYYLYYTDTFSTFSLVFLLLLANNFSSREKRSMINQLLVLFVTVACILARQTNAVWVLFIIGTNLLETLRAKERAESQSNGDRVTNAVSLIRNGENITLRQLFYFVSLLWHHKVELIASVWPLLLPVVGFVLFVVKNGGIVLGDKENHQPVLHWAMLVHMLFIAGLVNAPAAVSDLVVWYYTPEKIYRGKKPESIYGLPKLIAWFRRIINLRNCLSVIVCCTVVHLALVHGSFSHPFLLSDNRHYVFYLWKRVLSHTSTRVLLVPVYSVTIFVTLYRLKQAHGALWVLIFLIAAAISLVPTPLLEVRYFTPGVVIATIFSPHKNEASISSLSNVLHLLLLLGFTIINAVTIYVFLFKPFRWPDNSVARFMY